MVKRTECFFLFVKNLAWNFVKRNPIYTKYTLKKCCAVAEQMQLCIEECVLGTGVAGCIGCMAGPLVPTCPFVIIAVTAEAVLSLPHLRAG